MTPAQSHSVQYHLPHLRKVFDRLVEIENNPDIDWVALLELRERADPLSDDAWYRGYLVGVLDALGVSTEEAVRVLRTTHSGTRSRRKIVAFKKTDSSDSKEQNNGRR